MDTLTVKTDAPSVQDLRVLQERRRMLQVDIADMRTSLAAKLRECEAMTRDIQRIAHALEAHNISDMDAYIQRRNAFHAIVNTLS